MKRKLLVIVGRVLGAALLLLFHLVGARRLGPDIYGILALALAWSTLLSSLAALGWQALLTERLPKLHEAGRLTRPAHALLRSAQAVAFLTAVLISTLLLAFATILPTSLSIRALAVCAVLLPPTSLLLVLRRALEAVNQPLQSILYCDIVMPASAILLLLVVRPSQWHYGILLALPLLIASAFAAFGLEGSPRPSSLSPFSPSVILDSRNWRSAFEYLVGTFGQVSLTRLDTIALGLAPGSTALLVGAYSVARRLAMTTNYGLNALAPLIVADFGRAASSSSPDLRPSYLTYTAWATALGILPLALILLKPRFLLQLFQSDFSIAAAPMVILALGEFARALVGPSGYALIVRGSSRYFAVSNLAGVLLCIVLLAILVPTLSTIGAALSVGIAYIVVNVVQVYGVLFSPIRGLNNRA